MTLTGMAEAGGQGRRTPTQIFAEQKAPPGNGGAPHYFLPTQVFRPCTIPVRALVGKKQGLIKFLTKWCSGAFLVSVIQMHLNLMEYLCIDPTFSKNERWYSIVL